MLKPWLCERRSSSYLTKQFNLIYEMISVASESSIRWESSANTSTFKIILDPNGALCGHLLLPLKMFRNEYYSYRNKFSTQFSGLFYSKHEINKSRLYKKCSHQLRKVQLAGVTWKNAASFHIAPLKLTMFPYLWPYLNMSLSPGRINDTLLPIMVLNK